MRRAILLLVSIGGLMAAEPTATDIAAELIAERARDLAQHGDAGFAHQLEELSAGVRANRISLGDAQQVLAVAQALAPAGPPPGMRPRPPGLSAEQAGAALDGRPQPVPPPAAPAPTTRPAPPAAAAPAPTVAAVPPPTVAPAPPLPGASAPPAPVGSVAVATPAAPVPPAGPEPVVIGKLLAVQPGSDGKPALLALATNPKIPVKEGQRLAVRRDHATLALARVTKTGPDLTIALLIPGTWSDETAQIHADDEVALVDP
jgi:hypothetical protein